MNGVIGEAQINRQPTAEEVKGRAPLVEKTDSSAAMGTEQGNQSSTLTSFTAELSAAEASFQEVGGEEGVSNDANGLKLPEVNIRTVKKESGFGYLLPTIPIEGGKGNGDNHSGNNWLAILLSEKDQVLA